MIHAAIGDKATAAATSACWGIASVSDVNLLCDLDRVIDLNAEIANGTFDFGMPHSPCDGRSGPP
jgi:hypothetical protein